MEKTTLKQYIGTKTVKAEPMNESVAVEKGFARANKDGHRWREGYHVQYNNPDGSTYESWSPKDVFEKSYQIVEDFKDRQKIEFNELRIRLLKLHKFIQDNAFEAAAKKIGPEQGALLLSQYHGMSHHFDTMMNLYFDALKTHIEIFNEALKNK